MLEDAKPDDLLLKGCEVDPMARGQPGGYDGIDLAPAEALKHLGVGGYRRLHGMPALLKEQLDDRRGCFVKRERNMPETNGL
jgi:hypothetical protein